MPVGELIGEALGGVLKFVARFVFEVVFELLILGTGRSLVLLVRPRSDPGDALCAVVGLVFWVVVCAGAFGLYHASIN